ncbi:hypothetical protein LP417_33850 (plasmid) [Polaromonas sp. P1-6]|nr:hypothetical protein LP417_33850 [Polaromonas sp. P1-6]
MPTTPTAEMLREATKYINTTPAPEADQNSTALWLEGLYKVFVTTKPGADIRPDLMRALIWHSGRSEHQLLASTHVPQMCELVLDAAEGRIHASRFEGRR